MFLYTAVFGLWKFSAIFHHSTELILEGGVLTHIPPFHNILKSGQDRASFYFDSRVPAPPNF